MEAAASGSSSKEANAELSGRPRSSSTMARAVALGNGGTRSRSDANSSVQSGGKSPGLDAMT